MEKSILQAMLNDRSVYELFERLGNADSFSPIGKRVLAAVAEYYELDPGASNVSTEVIRERELGRLTNDKHRKPLEEYFKDLPNNVSSSNIAADIRELHRRSVGGKLSLALANGGGDEEVTKLIREYEAGGLGQYPDASSSTSGLVDVLDTSDLTAEGESNVDYIRFWPKALNDRLDGGALRGHHVLIFARPESGKTLFAINLCAGFLKQKLNVLYVGNEEPVADIRDRLRARLLGTTKASIRRDRTASAGRLAALQLGSLRITEGTSFADVRRLLSTGRPVVDVVILDQIRNMRVKSDSRTAELEAAGIEARALAKEFGILVVSITQAGDSATNKVYLEMSDVDSSKTGIPGAMDLMIGLGADEPMRANGLIGVSLCKNKIGGVHDRFTVTANFATGVIE
jgi:archaellum biogenesis ATPase FlaH